MSATVLRIETIVILKLPWVQQNNLFQDWKPLQTMSESIVQWLYSIFFFIMILDLIKWSSRCWPQKKKYKLKEKKRKGKSTTKESEGSSYFCNKHENDINKVLRNSIYNMGSSQTQTMDNPQTETAESWNETKFSKCGFCRKDKGLESKTSTRE